MIELYALKFDNNINIFTYNYLNKFISNEKKIKVDSFKNKHDSLRTLFGDLLIRYIILNKFSLRNEEIVFSSNKYGKPYISNVKNFYYNLSHSGNWIVCATDINPVGIDIEKIRAINLNGIKSFLSELEYSNLINKNKSDRLSYFFDIWTLKESFIKAIGKGLNIKLNSFTIDLMKDNISLDFDNFDNKIKKYYFKQFRIEPQYKLSICATNNKFVDKITIIDINKLLNFFQ